MRGSKFDFYKANILNKLKLFAKKPSFILFYLDRFRKYSGTDQFDAFIISYPKSGRTWLQKMMIEAVLQENGKQENLSDISKLHELVQNFPQLLSTHAGSSWEELVKDDEEIKVDDLKNYQHGKMIYLYRDPRDVLVSQYYHIQYRSGYKKFSKDHLIDNPNVGLKKIINFMNKWANYSEEHPEKIMALSYDQLKKDTESQLIQIFDFLKYPVNNHHIPEAIKKCSLERMQKAESGKSDNPWANTKTANNQNAFQSRKGISGEYKTFFNESEIEHINSIVDSQLLPYYSDYICKD